MLILASASPRRLELLKQIGITPDEIIPAEIDETPRKGELPKNYVARMAQEKCEAVASSFPLPLRGRVREGERPRSGQSYESDKQSLSHPLPLTPSLEGRGDIIVLAADTVVACGRRILGKPQDETEARAFLQLLSGRRHRVYTAICVNGRVKTVMTVVKFKALTSADIDDYIESGEWQGKAGGYAIQGRGGAFVPWINGSYSAVVGLPLTETLKLLTTS